MTVLTTIPTTEGLPPGKSVAEALKLAMKRRAELWATDLEEDDRIDALLRHCTRIYGGNVKNGQMLASLVLWS